MLIAAIVLGAICMALMITLGCGYLVISGMEPPGVCIATGVTAQLRELFSEVLTAVLALLLAARSGPPPPPPPPPSPPPE